MFTNFFSGAFVRAVLLSAGTLIMGLVVPAMSADSDQYKWSVQYLIDNSQSVFGRPQIDLPRNNRSLAITRDRHFLYAGYLRGFNNESGGSRAKYFSGKGELRKIDLTVEDYETATLAVLPDIAMPKALAVDDDGRVYVALGDQISIYDADLAHELEVIPTSTCEGVAVVRAGSGYVVYGTEREHKVLLRWEVSIAGVGVTKAKQCGFDGGTGEITIPGAVSPRMVAVDSHGRIWITDVDGDQVFRLEPTGRDMKVMKLHAPMGIAFDGAKGYVTLTKDLMVAIIDDEMNQLGYLAVPWKELELSAPGNQREGTLAGIVVDPGKGFYVANAIGQTVGQRSTYGRIDTNSDVINGKLYTDIFMDDNEPILHALIYSGGTEPAGSSSGGKNPSDLREQSNPSDLSKQPNPSSLAPQPLH